MIFFDIFNVFFFFLSLFLDLINAMHGKSRLPTKIQAKAICLANLMKRMNVQHNDTTKFVTDQIDHLFVCLRNGIRQPWNDWNIKAKTSTISNAGRGLFLEGHAPSGRLLCIYGGELWRPLDIDEALERLYAGNDCVQWDIDQLLNGGYTYARKSGGSFIEATPCPELHAILENNPLCLGYLANHPPKGKIPNMLPIDVPYKLDSGYMKYRHSWHRNKDVTDEQISVFLAMNDIANGEELFWDYDLGLFSDEGKNNLPEWYYSVDPNVFS
eukprot:934713_1